MNGYSPFSPIKLNFVDMSNAFSSRYWRRNGSNCV